MAVCPTNTRLRRLGALVLVCVLPTAWSCYSKYRGYRPEDVPPNTTEFSRVVGELLVEYTKRVDVNRPNAASDADNRPEFRVEEDSWEESIHLETDGFIYHPLLLELSLAGTFGLRQISLVQDDVSNDVSGTLTDFNVDGLALKKKEYPFLFHARRQTDLVPRQFSGSVEQETTRLGAEQRLLFGILPTELSVDRVQTRQSESGTLDNDNLDLDVVETSLGWHTRADFSDDHTLDWTLTLSTTEHNDETTGGPLDFGVELGRPDEEELDADLHDSWTFGSEKEFLLDSRLRRLDQRGDPTLVQTNWRERLDVTHDETFKTYYLLDVEDFQQTDQTEQTRRAGAGLQHRLYGSLFTTADGYALQRDFSGGADQEEVSGAINFDYRKKNPWGVLNILLGADTTQRREGGEVSTASVVDQTLVLSGATPVRLAQTRIITSSIVVTDPTGLVIYDQGSDYRLRSVGNFIEIERVVGGDIPDPGAVLVDYQFQTGGGIDTDTTNWTAGVRQTFKGGLSVYGRHQTQDQTLSGNVGDFVPDNVDSDVIGAEFRDKGLFLRAEAEDRRATVSPLEAVRLLAQYTVRVMRELALRASAEVTTNRFVEESGVGARQAQPTEGQEDTPEQDRTTERQEDIVSLGGGANITPLANLFIDFDVVYFTEEDTLEGTTEGLSVRSTLKWHYRQWSLEIRLEHHELLESFSSDRTDDRLVVTVIRRF